jgi:hypothetical protein
LVFAVNTFDRFNTAANAEVDINIDSDGDGIPDYDVFSYDLGALTTGSPNGQVAISVLNLHTGSISVLYTTDAPTDGSILLLQVLTSEIGLLPSNPRFSYQVQSWNSIYTGAPSNVVPGVASFNAFTPAISNGDWVPVAPGTTTHEPAAIHVTEWAKTPGLGLMIVDQENRSGAAQAALLRVSR